MPKRARGLFHLLVAISLGLGGARLLRADECQREYEARIHHVEHVMAEQHRELELAHERAERAYREHRGSRERREELKRDWERARERMKRMKEDMRARRADAERDYRDCQRRHRH